MKHGLNVVIIMMMFCLEIGAQTSGAIDMHSHIIIQEYLDVLRKHDALLEEGFPLPEWKADNHLKMMDEEDIAVSVLSMPAPQPWFGNVEECERVIRSVNETCAKLKAEYPERFLFCASLPLPDVGAAIREAVYTLDTLHADGIKMATNSYGQYLGDAELDSLMWVLNERGTVVLIHPHKPAPVNERIMQTVPLAIYEYPAETTRAVLNLIARNVPARYPNVKFVVPHCGSFLPLAIARMKGVHPIMERAGLMGSIDWDNNLKNFYYDLAGNLTPEVLKALLTITTGEHLLYGSDYPYVNAQGVKKAKENLLNVLCSDEEWRDMGNAIWKNNAVKLMKYGN